MTNVLKKVKCNVLDMLAYRKCIISEESISDFKKSNTLKFETESTYDMFIISRIAKFSKSVLKNLVETNIVPTSKKININLIILDNISSNSIQNNIKIIEKENNVRINLFHFESFLVNPTKHSLFSHHEKVVHENIDEFKKDLCDKLYIEKIEQLPKISVNDVMAKYIDLKIGEIVKITRNTANSSNMTIYKICV